MISLEATAITRKFLEEHYRGQEAHSAILFAVEKGVRDSPVGQLTGSYLPIYVDKLLTILYDGLPPDPEIVQERILGLETMGFSEGPLIANQLEVEAYLKNTEKGAEMVPIGTFRKKRLKRLAYT